MKTAPSGLVTLLGTGSFVFCDLYVFTLTTGQVLRYTTADVDVTYGGNSYSSALFFDQSGNKAVGHWKTGLDVDTWQVHVMPVVTDPVTGGAGPAIGSTPWLAAVAAGALDGAYVDIHRAYWPSWPQPWSAPLAAYADGSGTYVIVDYFAGRVAACDLMRNQAVISVNSWLDQLMLQMPRRVWGSPCRYTLYDPGCGLTQASFAVSGTVISVASQTTLVLGGIGSIPGSGTLALGQITFTGGLNNGFRRMIRSGGFGSGGYVIAMIAPLPFTPQVGDAFTAYPGCDKTLLNATGCTGFANTVNFGGQDLIPVPETAV